MTIEELLCEAYQKVHKDQAKLIIATLLNQNPLELTMHLDLKVNEDIINKYQECLDNIINGLPIQFYLCGGFGLCVKPLAWRCSLRL